MADSVEREIRELRALFWSERDPEGKAFAPLADAYLRMGDLDQALEVLSDGLDRHGDFAPGFVVAGWVRRARGEAELAAKAFTSALELDDENTEALRGLADVADERGEAGVAADCRRRLAELEPGTNGDAPPAAETELPSFEEAMFEPPAFPEAASSMDDDPWGAEADRVTTTDDVAIPDELAHTADIVVDFGETDQALPPPPVAERQPRAPAADPWASPVRAQAEGEDGPVTRTMADLYARQNLHERALRLYRRLLERTPGDAALADRVREMEALIAVDTVGTAEHPVPIAELAPSPIGGPVESAAETATGAPAGEAQAAPPAEMPTAEAASAPAESARRAPGRPSRRPSEADVETLARDWAEGPGDTGELSTPFAWATRPAEPTTRDTEVGRPIGDYFRSLLAWEPGMEPPTVEPEPPAAEAVAAVQTAAVEAVTAVESAAAQAVTAVQAAAVQAVTAVGAAAAEAAAAPSVPGADARTVVPIESLAPDGRPGRVVPIESLGPKVVDIAALAPHVVEIATLAPDRPAGAGASGWMDALP